MEPSHAILLVPCKNTKAYIYSWNTILGELSFKNLVSFRSEEVYLEMHGPPSLFHEVCSLTRFVSRYLQRHNTKLDSKQDETDTDIYLQIGTPSTTKKGNPGYSI
jgi:hypothetical protein